MRFIFAANLTVSLAAAIYFTRGIDWYSQLAGPGTQEQQSQLLVPKDPA
jgi:hypothetical protein